MAITTETRRRIIDAAKREIADLLDEHAIGIAKAFDEAEKDVEPDKMATLAVGLGVKFSRDEKAPNVILADCKIAYATKKCEKRTVVVRTGKDMVDAMQSADGAKGVEVTYKQGEQSLNLNQADLKNLKKNIDTALETGDGEFTTVGAGAAARRLMDEMKRSVAP